MLSVRAFVCSRGEAAGSSKRRWARDVPKGESQVAMPCSVDVMQ